MEGRMAEWIYCVRLENTPTEYTPGGSGGHSLLCGYYKCIAETGLATFEKLGLAVFWRSVLQIEESAIELGSIAPVELRRF